MLNEKLTALYELRTTLERVRDEGLELWMPHFYSDKYGISDECGAVACAAGWMAFFREGKRQPDTARDLSLMSASAIAEELPPKPDEADGVISFVQLSKHARKIWSILFGPRRGYDLSVDETITRQLVAVNWFIHREEALVDYAASRVRHRAASRAWHEARVAA